MKINEIIDPHSNADIQWEALHGLGVEWIKELYATVSDASFGFNEPASNVYSPDVIESIFDSLLEARNVLPELFLKTKSGKMLSELIEYFST